MINNDITREPVPVDTPLPQKPNESTGLYVRGFVKISDPETGEIIVETGN
jgi:hypothetical protein